MEHELTLIASPPPAYGGEGVRPQKHYIHIMFRLSVLLLVFTFVAQCGLFHFWPVITHISLAGSLLFAVAFIGATNFIWKVNLDDLITAAKQEGNNEQLHRNDGDDWW